MTANAFDEICSAWWRVFLLVDFDGRLLSTFTGGTQTQIVRSPLDASGTMVDKSLLSQMECSNRQASELVQYALDAEGLDYVENLLSFGGFDMNVSKSLIEQRFL